MASEVNGLNRRFKNESESDGFEISLMPFLFTAYPGQASVGMPKTADFLTRKTCQPD